MSECIIDGFVEKLKWAKGVAPACIVRTVDDGARYAFAPSDIRAALGAASPAWLLASKEIAMLHLRARIDRGFEAPDLSVAPPKIGKEQTALDSELRRLQKLV